MMMMMMMMMMIIIIIIIFTLLNRKSDVHQLSQFRTKQTTIYFHFLPTIHVFIVWQFIKRNIPTTNKLSTNGLRNGLHSKSKI